MWVRACLALGSIQARVSTATPAQCGLRPSHITRHSELKNAHTSERPGENIVKSHDDAIICTKDEENIKHFK